MIEVVEIVIMDAPQVIVGRFRKRLDPARGRDCPLPSALMGAV